MQGTERDQGDLELEFSRLGDAQVARLLALVGLPALSARGPARRLVRSAIARLVRADGGALADGAVRAVQSAVEATAAASPAPRIRVYASPRSR
jgi:hypothetical protein